MHLRGTTLIVGHLHMCCSCNRGPSIFSQHFCFIMPYLKLQVISVKLSVRCHAPGMDLPHLLLQTTQLCRMLTAAVPPAPFRQPTEKLPVLFIQLHTIQQIRAMLQRPVQRLIPPPAFHICMMSRHEHRRCRCVMPNLRAAVLRIFQQAVLEKLSVWPDS